MTQRRSIVQLCADDPHKSFVIIFQEIIFPANYNSPVLIIMYNCNLYLIIANYMCCVCANYISRNYREMTRIIIK